MILSKIISGGQTGVDRGALDAALAADFHCGGWCPPGRPAEDGVIPNRYPLIEMPGGSYRQRTIKNVMDSDGTLIIYFSELQTGTKLTAETCIRKNKPYLLIDAAAVPVNQAIELAARFIEDQNISVLNVAGPRATKAPAGHQYAFDVISGIILYSKNLTKYKYYK